MAEAPINRIAIVRNPRSGSVPDADTLGNALRTAGLSARIVDIPQAPGFEAWIDRLAAEVEVLVAAGGDGTVSTVAHAAAKARRIFGLIPAGTLNHFARDTGIPTELDAAIDVLRNGRVRCVDVGVVNDRLFLNNVSLGNYPRMVRERTGLIRHGLPKRIAGAIAAFDTWWDLRNMTAALTLDQRALVRRSPFIVIANGSYLLSGFDLGRREQINDGCLSVYVAPPSGRLGALSWPVRALIGTLERHEQFETLKAQATRITVGPNRIAVAIDGEVRELDSPLEFSIRRQALRVLVPRDANL